MKKHAHSSRFLVLLCYGAGLALWLVLHLAGFVQNRLGYANGTLVFQELTLADFTLFEAEASGEGFVTTGTDPQLRLADETRRVENITIEFEYSAAPYGINVFYRAPGQSYAPTRMAYGRQTENGLSFLLPAGGVQGLRIDPGNAAGNIVTIKSIRINQPRAFLSFFQFSAGEAALLLLLPGLVACGLSILLPVPQLLQERKAAKAGGNAQEMARHNAADTGVPTGGEANDTDIGHPHISDEESINTPSKNKNSANTAQLNRRQRRKNSFDNGQNPPPSSKGGGGDG